MSGKQIIAMNQVGLKCEEDAFITLNKSYGKQTIRQA